MINGVHFFVIESDEDCQNWAAYFKKDNEYAVTCVGSWVEQSEPRDVEQQDGQSQSQW